jgi:hypothetical protein
VEENSETRFVNGKLKNYYRNLSLKLEEPEVIEEVILVTGTAGKWLMVHTNKSVFRTDINFTITNICDFNIVGENLEEICIGEAESSYRHVEVVTNNRTLII